MNQDIYDLVIEVAQGNPGALTVLKELQWYTSWYQMMKYMQKTGLVGEKIWEKYKDEYHRDIHKFALSLEKEIILNKIRK